MTTEQRFERIEADLAGTTAILRVVATSQEIHVAALGEFTATISRYIDSSEARLKRLRKIWTG